MASTHPDALSRRRQPGAIRTLVLICGIQPPGFADHRPRGRLPAGAAEIVRGGFFSMATIYNNPLSNI